MARGTVSSRPLARHSRILAAAMGTRMGPASEAAVRRSRTEGLVMGMSIEQLGYHYYHYYQLTQRTAPDTRMPGPVMDSYSPL